MAVFLFCAIFQKLTTIPMTYTIVGFWVVEIVYFIFTFFHCQWLQFTHEKEQTFKQLKSK